MAPASALTAGSACVLPSQPLPTKDSCSDTRFIARVQMSSESAAFEVP
jgi:hypothetical protein